MITRVLAVALAATCLLWLAVAPRPARADGDPASDVLLGENVFYPYRPAVSAPIEKRLNATTAAAKRAGFPIKVALIASPVDLGVIPDLFGKPQKYADFLDQEISFQTKQPLLVVMSTGYGLQGVAPKTAAAVTSLPKPGANTSNALATAATTAVQKLADAAGHPVSPGGSSGSSSGSTALIAGLAAAAVVIALALGVLTLRRRRATA